MRTYLDDDLDADRLIGLLRHAGHEVVSPRGVGTRGVADEEHLRFAAANELVLHTANARDFVDLSRAWRNEGTGHSGVLTVYRENNPARDMSFEQVALAVTRIEQSGMTLENDVHNLNFWR